MKARVVMVSLTETALLHGQNTWNIAIWRVVLHHILEINFSSWRHSVIFFCSRLLGVELGQIRRVNSSHSHTSGVRAMSSPVISSVAAWPSLFCKRCQVLTGCFPFGHLERVRPRGSVYMAAPPGKHSLKHLNSNTCL